MADLPERILRLHALRWKDLIERHGFTGAHLVWHESKERRHDAARPLYSLAPPPPRILNSNTPHSSVTHFGRNRETVAYEEWRKIQEEDWITRESDPVVVDSIGIVETVALAKCAIRRSCWRLPLDLGQRNRSRFGHVRRAIAGCPAVSFKRDC